MQPSDNRALLFEQIFYDTKDKVFGFLKRILRDDTKAQDCMQQCYLKLWETLDTIDTDKDVLPLLYTYSRNIGIDILRKNIHYVWMDDLTPFSEKLTAEFTPQTYVNQKEAVTELEELLNDMPGRRKQVFKLIKLSGFTYREVSQQLNISVSTVEKHMHEAHKSLEI
jgi:RNA polymerase sigma factor (sigma-70 family)